MTKRREQQWSPEEQVLYLTLTLTLDGREHTKRVQVPEEHAMEGWRRMESPPTPDGQRWCLNRCPLPFYAWIRDQYRQFYQGLAANREREVEYRLNGVTYYMPQPELPPWEETIPAHPHVGTAEHWFAPLLEEAG